MKSAYSQANRRTRTPYRVCRAGNGFFDSETLKVGVDQFGISIYRKTFKFVGDSVFVDTNSRGEFWLAFDDQTSNPLNAIHCAPGQSITGLPYGEVSVFFRYYSDIYVSLVLSDGADFSFGSSELIGPDSMQTVTLAPAASAVGVYASFSAPTVVRPVYTRATILATGVTGSALYTFGYGIASEATPRLPKELDRIVASQHISGGGGFTIDFLPTSPGSGEQLFVVCTPTSATYTATVDATASWRNTDLLR